MKWCGQPDLNRHSSYEPRDVHTNYGFRRIALARSRIRLVCGLDYTFNVTRASTDVQSAYTISPPSSRHACALTPTF